MRASNSLLKPRRTLLLVILVVCGCVQPNQENRSLLDGYPAPEADPPEVRNPTPAEAANFGFRFESRCVFEIIDAFRKTYHTYGMTAPIPMTLTNHERATILEVVAAVRFFDLPATMNYPDMSKMTSELAVHNGIAYHAVRWRRTANFPYSEEHHRLLKLVRTILDVVHARPEVSPFRPRGSGC